MEAYAYLKDVVTLSLDPSKCNGCKMCASVCPHAVFTFEDDKARIVRRDHCMECGACANNCKQGAIDVEAGVGCANAVINSAIGKKGECCC